MRKFSILIPILMIFTSMLMSQIKFEPSMVKQLKVSKETNKIFSRNRRFSCLIEYSLGNSEYIPINRFILKNKSGETIYEKTQLKHTLIDISNNGEIVGIDYDGPISGKAGLHFYNTEGVEIGTNSVGFLLERCFSTKSNVYCINDGNSGLRVFKLNGEELYNLGKCNWFSVSFDGNYIAVTQDTVIILFEQDNQISRIPLSSPFIRQIKFSEDGSLLGYIDRKSIYLYSILEQKIIFQYNEKNNKLKFTSFDITSDNSAIILGLAEDKGRGMPDRHTRGYVYFFDMSGELHWKGEIRFNKWNAYIPRVSFTGSCTFKVITVNDIYEYQF